MKSLVVTVVSCQLEKCWKSFLMNFCFSLAIFPVQELSKWVGMMTGFCLSDIPSLIGRKGNVSDSLDKLQGNFFLTQFFRQESIWQNNIIITICVLFRLVPSE